MSSRNDDRIPEKHYLSKAWLKKYGSAHIPEGDTLHIIDPFLSAPHSTSADPKLSPPPFSYDKFKHWLAYLDQEQTLRFEVNQSLFDEICSTTKTAKEPLFKLLNQHTLVYLRYDLIPIVLIPDQVEPLKIIKLGRKY